MSDHTCEHAHRQLFVTYGEGEETHDNVRMLRAYHQRRAKQHDESNVRAVPGRVHRTRDRARRASCLVS
jgi:hypothetical protein